MKLLVVGNGSTAVDSDNGYYINNHTGNLLKNINDKCEVDFLQFRSSYIKDNDLLNFNLKKTSVRVQIVSKVKKIFLIAKLCYLVIKTDKVYLFYPGSLSTIVGLISLIFRKPYGLYIRGQYYNRGLFDRLLLKNAKFILTVSPTISEDVQRFCNDVDLIRPMISINLEDFNYSRDYSSKDCYKLLYVGRVEYRKGVFELIEIARLLKMKDMNFSLNIIGGGDSINAISAKIKEYGLNDCVILHGLITDAERLKDIYDSSDVFVFTSHDEGFPRVLYEAMASGLPIFTTFVGGIPGRMINAVNCFEIPVNDALGAAEVIYKNILNYSSLDKIGKSSQNVLAKILDGNLLTHEEILWRKIRDEK